MSIGGKMKFLLKSLPNARDFSQYINKEGLSIKPHKLIRGDCLNNITEEEFIELHKDIKVIIDLRNSKEISKKADNFLNKFDDVKYFNFCLLDEEFFKEIGLYESVDTFINKYSDRDFDLVLQQMYSQFITNDKSISAFKNIFKVIVENVDDWVYYHCITGRDRTGILTAVIMLALDFSEDDIIKEYLLTNSLRKDFNENRKKNALQEGKSEEYIQKLMKFSIVSEDNLTTFFNAIKARYQSYNNFFNAIGLDKNNLSILKKSLMEQEKNLDI